MEICVQRNLRILDGSHSSTSGAAVPQSVCCYCQTLYVATPAFLHTLQERIGLAERSKAAIALENCVMAAIHSQVFDNIAQIHKAEDTALHAFLEQLMAGQYDLYGTSPDLHVQVSAANG